MIRLLDEREIRPPRARPWLLFAILLGMFAAVITVGFVRLQYGLPWWLPFVFGALAGLSAPRLYFWIVRRGER